MDLVGGRAGATLGARCAIEEADECGVAAISCWEVAMLVRAGRLTLDRPAPLWIRQALVQPRVSPVPLTPEIATAAGLLEGCTEIPPVG